MKKKTLRSALATAASVVPSPGEGRLGARADGRGHRSGRVNITGYFPPEYRQRLHMVQAKRINMSVQDLVGEALNLLFEKYGVTDEMVNQ